MPAATHEYHHFLTPPDTGPAYIAGLSGGHPDWVLILKAPP